MASYLPFAAARLDTVDAAALAVGDTLPSLTVPVTATLIVTGAIASRDFFPGHHDAAQARAAGQPDVFMNIMTTAGLLSRFITDWAGSGAVLLSLNLTLGAPNLPGDTMTISGVITGIEPDRGATTVAISVAAINERARHATADARLRLLRHGAEAPG